MNAGSDKTTNPIITCNGTTCEVQTLAGDCNTIGKVSTGNKLCLSSENDGTVDITVETEESATPSYETLNVASDGFPGVTTEGKIAVKINTDGSALLLEDISLPECKGTVPSNNSKCQDSNNDKEVEHCISGEKIYISGTGTTKTCKPISHTAIGTKVFFFKDDATTADITNSETPVMAYQCTFTKVSNNVTLEKCVLVQGYVIDNGKIYQCNGWKYEECKSVTTTACDSGTTTNGVIGKDSSDANASNAICFGETPVVLPSDSDTPTYSLLAFTLPDTTTSSEYGMMAGEIVKLNITSTDAIVTTFGSGKSLFISL